MTYYFPGAQTLSAAQITQEWEAAGAPANVARAFGGPLTTAEGASNTGALYNTVFPSLPGYTPPTVGAPEYSVGLYGENIYGDLGVTNPQQAFAIGQALTKDPQYQTDVAAQMFSQRGFQPWEGDAYVKGQGGPGSALAALGYSSPPQIKGGVPFTANVPKAAAAGAGTKTPTPSSSSSNNPAKQPSAGSIWNPLNNLSIFKPAPTVGPSLLPWNWPSDAANATWSSALTLVIVVVGLVLVAWGLKITFERSSSGGGGGGEPVIINDAEHAAEAAPLAA